MMDSKQNASKYISAAKGIFLLTILTHAFASAEELSDEAKSSANTTIEVPVVELTAPKASVNPLSGGVIEAHELAEKKTTVMDTARLLEDIPGVSTYGAGAISALPVIHGLADERLRLQVDGMDMTAACPNHMNSVLSYINPTRVGVIKVFSGITPVSEGGDSLGGTIQVSAAPLAFASEGDWLVNGSLGSFYRSNGYATGWNASAGFATDHVSMQYSESHLKSANYRAAKRFKDVSQWPSQDWLENTDDDEVASSAISGSVNQSLDVAFKHESHLLQLGLSQQSVGFEGFPNQRMDMTDNKNTTVNLRYAGQFDWGDVQAKMFRQHVKHAMDIGAQRADQAMPMLSDAETLGASLKVSAPIMSEHLLRVGTELLSYRLDDWWPPVGTAVGSMCCNEFQNIRNGQRDKVALFAEMESSWRQDWLTLIGVRTDIVNSNAGDVQGYSNTASYRADAASFNAQSRGRRDLNWDWTALTRYMPTPQQTYEFGFARKSRAPSLYERYAWSTFSMAALMNNFVGDGNGYIGNLELEPEVAHTANIAFEWHDETQAIWSTKLNAYYTYINDYIDAKRCNFGRCPASLLNRQDSFVLLQYVNQSARLHGFDFSAYRQLISSDAIGVLSSRAVISYVRGENTTTGDNLYHIMPLNGRFSLEHKLGGWLSTAELQLVSDKRHVSQVRNETRTDGYGLLNLRTSYTNKFMRVDLGLENALNKLYFSPLGGAYLGQGDPMSTSTIPWGINLPGMGRSANVAVTFFY